MTSFHELCRSCESTWRSSTVVPNSAESPVAAIAARMPAPRRPDRIPPIRKNPSGAPTATIDEHVRTRHERPGREADLPQPCVEIKPSGQRRSNGTRLPLTMKTVTTSAASQQMRLSDQSLV